jgi:prophage antirepressor-like protein
MGNLRAGYGQNHLVFFGEHVVQTIERNRDLWFLATDLGKMLELTNIRENLRQLKDDEKDWCYIEPKDPWPTAKEVFASKTEGQVSGILTPDPLKNRKLRRQKVRVVDEAGLYRLILMSRTPAAKVFQDWVVRDVLTMIRKTGKYRLRKTTPLVFLPKSMTKLQQTRIFFRNRYRHLTWVTPYTPTAEEQAALDAQVAMDTHSSKNILDFKPSEALEKLDDDEKDVLTRASDPNQKLGSPGGEGHEGGLYERDTAF